MRILLVWLTFVLVGAMGATNKWAEHYEWECSPDELRRVFVTAFIGGYFITLPIAGVIYYVFGLH